MRKHTPIHPGVTLKEDFLEPLKMSATALAEHLRVPPNRITRIINGQTAISADTALRLESAFGVSAQFWMNLQQQYELLKAQEQADSRKGIRQVQAA